MEKTGLFKKVDRIAGTPACFLLGIIEKLLSRGNDPSPTLNKILVIKFVAIGDLVVTLPALRAIKKTFPESHLAVLVTPRAREVVEGCAYVDKVISYDILGGDKGLGGLIRIIRRLRRGKFDLVLELDHYYRITTLISYLAGIPNRAGFDLPGQGRRNLYTTRIPYSVAKHEVDVFLKAAEWIGADASEKELVEIWVPQEDREYVDGFLKSAGVTKHDTLIGIHPGTGPSALSRRWPLERFAQLADWLIIERGAKIVITGSPSETDLVENIAERMSTEPIVAAGKTNLKQFAEIARRCRLFISVDTGPLHIAAAMKTQVVGLFGPNTPLKWGPYGDGHIVIYKGLDCSPCTKQYLGQVSKCKNPICMSAITAEDVKTAVRRLLDS